jgi:hypothetical protein
MPPTSTRHPPAAVCDGRYRVADRLYGTDALGVWLGEDAEEGPPVLVTLGPYALGAEDELALDVPGVPALLAVDDLDGERTALVEQRPAGAIARPAPEEVAALGAEVAAVAAFAHHMGLALGGIRPEAVWRDAEVAVAPRLTRLWELSGSGSGPGSAALPGVYLSLGRLRGGGPVPSDDVFALGATVACWATGAHPFEGDTPAEQVHAIHDGRRRPWTGDPRLESVVAAALAPPDRRPGMEQLEAALRELA